MTDSAAANDLNYLPGWLREMAKDCGIAAVLRLIEWRGGRRAYVPERAAVNFKMTQAIGTQATAWLSARFAAEWLDIPRCLSYLLAARDAQIAARWQAGESSAMIAGDLDLTRERIRQILRAQAVTVDDRQQALFD